MNSFIICMILSSLHKKGGIPVKQSLYPKRRRQPGDRYDGFRLRKLDPFFVLIPHIMKRRTGSMVFFEERIEISQLEKFIRRLRRESEMKDLSLLQVIMAAAVRMIATHPGVNRFVAGRRLYARNSISLSLSIKKSMSTEGAETTITPCFSPADTLPDVWRRLHDEFAASKNEEDNGTDRLAALFAHLPVFLVKWTVWLVNGLDQLGRMPKAIHRLSPFHASAFIVDNGSLGIGSVYHHLYDFGTCSVFISIGRKESTLKIDENDNIKTEKTMNIRFVVDERICDGYYFAITLRDFRRLLRHPEQLLTVPGEFPEDPQL